jgi:hypothetical protein
MPLKHHYICGNDILPVEYQTIDPDDKVRIARALNIPPYNMVPQKFVELIKSLFSVAELDRTLPELVVYVRNPPTAHASCRRSSGCKSCDKRFPSGSWAEDNSRCADFKVCRTVFDNYFKTIRKIGEYCVLILEAAARGDFVIDPAWWNPLERFCVKAETYFNIIMAYGKMPFTKTHEIAATVAGAAGESYQCYGGWDGHRLANYQHLGEDFNLLRDEWENLRPNLPVA